MARHGITFRELLEVMRVCAAVLPGRKTPPYFRAFLTERLAGSPALAAKVSQLGSDEMDELRELIRAAHQFSCGSGSDPC